MARIPAHEIEKVVMQSLHQNLYDVLGLDEIEDYALIQHLTRSELPLEKLIKSCIKKITVLQEKLDISVDIPKLKTALEAIIEYDIPSRNSEPDQMISVSFCTRRSYKGAVILKPDVADNDLLDLPLPKLKNLIRGIIWRDEHFGGTSLKDIAARENLSESGVRKIIMRSFDTLLAT